MMKVRFQLEDNFKFYFTLCTQKSSEVLLKYSQCTPLSLAPLYTPLYIFCCGIIKFE